MSVVLALAAGHAHAEPPAATARPAADLDGTYLWLGPSGAATRIAGSWESSWGGGLQVLRVRERAPLGVAGGWLGAVHYAGRDGGRLWLDAVAGTRIAGRMVGVAAGPAVELGPLHHPRLGASLAIWAFAGVTPVVRVGALAEAGTFVELGVSLALPARRW